MNHHSPAASVFLHLFPGALLTGLFVLAVPFGERMGVPSFTTFLVIGILVLLPFELGFLFWEGLGRNASLSLEGVVVFRQSQGIWHSIALAIPLFLWGVIAFAVVNPPVEAAIVSKLFSWVPESYFLGSFASNVGDYSPTILLGSAVVLLVVNGVVGPVVEEMYFRGYLLPRMSWSGRWAPLLNSVLFSLYHFFTPWQNPTRIVALTPFIYVVWWKKNIYLGIAVHCLMNLVASVGFLLLVLRFV